MQVPIPRTPQLGTFVNGNSETNGIARCVQNKRNDEGQCPINITRVKEKLKEISVDK